MSTIDEKAAWLQRKQDGAGEAGRALTCSEWAAKRLGFEADELQRQVLDSKAKQGILNCCRQWGKSTVTAVKAVHRAYTERGSLVIVASPSERQSREFLRKAKELVKKLGIVPVGDGDNEVSLLFPNGSRIVGLPGTESTVRGFSAVSLLLIDEASRVPEEMYRALRPMRATTFGEIWLMSTPFGTRGFFWKAWTAGGDAWERISAPAEECSRISPAFLEMERGEMGELWYAQEFGCRFVDNGSQLYPLELVERAMLDRPRMEL